jgi:beta-phosphoglucomutase-like phosphatase (HAD superfamily)
VGVLYNIVELGENSVIKGLFFDLDGTLVNTYRADFLAYREAVQEVTGLELIEADYAALHGMEIGAKLGRLIPGLTARQVDGIRQAKKLGYPKHVGLTVLNHGLTNFLAQMSSYHHCVLVTTAKHDNVTAVLGHHDLERYFQHIISGDDVARHKPDPEAYLLALEKTGLQPLEALAFEDSPSGVESAEAAGIPVVRITEFTSP